MSLEGPSYLSVVVECVSRFCNIQSNRVPCPSPIARRVPSVKHPWNPLNAFCTSSADGGAACTKACIKHQWHRSHLSGVPAHTIRDDQVSKHGGRCREDATLQSLGLRHLDFFPTLAQLCDLLRTLHVISACAYRHSPVCCFAGSGL